MRSVKSSKPIVGTRFNSVDAISSWNVPAAAELLYTCSWIYFIGDCYCWILVKVACTSIWKLAQVPLNNPRDTEFCDFWGLSGEKAAIVMQF